MNRPVPSQPRIDQLAEQIRDVVRGGRTPEDAARRLATFVPTELVQQALQRFREASERVRTMREPGGIIDPYLESWYTGPDPGDKLWPAYRDKLLREGFEEAAVARIDEASTRIVSLLRPPGAAQIRTRGLVLGHVQSGKTANFTAVIAKAADAGYRFFLVLSGLNNALRNQTQARIEDDLVDPHIEDWISITDANRDFRQTGNVNAFLTKRQAAKVLGVVKKNAPRLRRLREWLRGARPEVLRECPTLVIDDEADQASPNTQTDPERRTAINSLIVELLLSMPKAAYVGYTATPFANLFIDPAPPEDLYPRDFIIDLPRSDGYFGPERIFGRDPVDSDDAGSDGLNMIRMVPDDDTPLLRPARQDERHDFVPSIAPSLEDALLYFWMVTATRMTRNQGTDHSTMLIHTSRYAAVHLAYKPVVERFRDQVLQQVRRTEHRLYDLLREFWDREQRAVPPEEVGETGTAFDDLLPHLAEAVGRTEVKIENARSADRIDYATHEGEPGRIYIVIGGDVLSRGLTLEGLSVSYFVRGAAAYDTLLQMGRWFGYREGYADLPRMWMTEELRRYYYDLAAVEKEIREDIDRYKSGHVTPLDFAVRIRTHPQLAITSKLKMQRAVPAKMSFAGHRVQTIVFDHEARDWLEANLEAGKGLIARLLGNGIEPVRLQNRPHAIFHDVPAEEVLQFLAEYQIHENNTAMPSDLIDGYIREQNAREQLKLWNVVVVGRQTPDQELGTIEFGLGDPVPLINRARFLPRGDPRLADVKALMSEMDPVIDLDMPTHELRGRTLREMQQLRDRQAPQQGLVLLYPVSKDSRPLRYNPDRARLSAAAHVLGLALVFPDTDDLTPQSYMTVRMDHMPQEFAELEEMEGEDA